MGRKRILIVEDEEVARNLYRRLLARLPALFDMVTTLKEARNQLAGAENYDVLVTDMRLPDGRGSDVAEEFRRKNPKGRILIITGSPESYSSSKLGDIVPGAEWLFKPFEIDDFTKTLERLLSK